MRDFGQTPSRLLSKRGQLGNQMAWIWSVDQVSGDDPSLKLRREVTCGSRSIAEYFGTKAPHDGSKAGLCPDRTVERIRSTSRPPLWNPEPKSNRGAMSCCSRLTTGPQDNSTKVGTNRAQRQVRNHCAKAIATPRVW